MSLTSDQTLPKRVLSRHQSHAVRTPPRGFQLPLQHLLNPYPGTTLRRPAGQACFRQKSFEKADSKSGPLCLQMHPKSKHFSPVQARLLSVTRAASSPGFLIIDQIMSPQLRASWAPLVYRIKSKAFQMWPTRPHLTAPGTLTSLVPSRHSSRGLLLCLTLGFLPLRGLPLVPLSPGGTSSRESRPPFPQHPFNPYTLILLPSLQGTSHHPERACLFGPGICHSRASRRGQEGRACPLLLTAGAARTAVPVPRQRTTQMARHKGRRQRLGITSSATLPAYGVFPHHFLERPQSSLLTSLRSHNH